jgi:uncharacterized membrane protein
MRRRGRQSENERLLAQGPREAPERQILDERKGRSPSRAGVIAALAFITLAALHLVSFLVWWAVIPLALFGLAFSFSRFVRRPRRRRSTNSPLRVFFLLWLAVSVAVGVLVALAGFQRSDLVLLAVVWTILAALWVADRGLSRIWKAR